MDIKTKSYQALKEIVEKNNRGKIVDVDEDRVKLVFFTLLNERYAIYGKNVNEILALTKIHYVPGSSDFVLGIINVRGDIESVLDLAKLLGLPSQIMTDRCRIIIAEIEKLRSGILVGSVEDVMDVSVSQIKPPIMTIDRKIKEFVTGETSYGNHNVTVLDIGRILRQKLGEPVTDQEHETC